MPTASVAERFRALYTGLVTDVMDQLGLRHQTLSPELSPLRPGMRLAGPAFTIEGAPRPDNEYDPSIRKILKMLGEVPAGAVAVYQTHSRDAAQLGELSVTSLRARGCAGAVLDGGCRDVELILAQDFPVFSRYTTPQDCVVRWELARTGEPIVAGGVRVAPGDWIVADWDGVVCVPADVVDEVLARAEAKLATESEIRRAVLDGMLPLEAYERYGTF